MPIFEYRCKQCGKKFEAIVLGNKSAECPQCHGGELEQQLSTFSVHSGGATSNAAKAPCGLPGGSCGSGMCGMN